MNVKVYDIEGNLVTGYDYDEIRKFVLKKKAYWKSENAIQLTVSDKELNKRRTISKSLRKKSYNGRGEDLLYLWRNYRYRRRHNNRPFN